MQPAGPVTRMIPEGDDHERLVCADCGFVLYENPKVIVGAVCSWEDRTLLCRRAIEPRRGYWTMPIGYMELGETTEQGALREVWEETLARAEIDALLGLYSIPEISQVHLIYRAHMLTPDCASFQAASMKPSFQRPNCFHFAIASGPPVFTAVEGSGSTPKAPL